MNIFLHKPNALMFYDTTGKASFVSVETEINSIKGIGVLICVDILHLFYH